MDISSSRDSSHTHNGSIVSAYRILARTGSAIARSTTAICSNARSLGIFSNTRPTRLGSSLYASHVTSLDFRTGLFVTVAIRFKDCLIVDEVQAPFSDHPGRHQTRIAFRVQFLASQSSAHAQHYRPPILSPRPPSPLALSAGSAFGSAASSSSHGRNSPFHKLPHLAIPHTFQALQVVLDILLIP